MKKTLILLGLIIIIALNGCGKSKVSCTITSPMEGAEISIHDDLVVTVEATDSKGTIAMVIIYLDNAPYPTTGTNPFTATIPSILLELGKHTIKAIATNTEGGQGEASIMVNITESGGSADESPNFVTFADGKIPPSWKTNTWVVDVAMGYDDNYALRADHTVSSVVTNKTINIASYIEFYIRGEDYFDFYIDNVKVQPFSSTTLSNNWGRWIYVLEKGKHSFRWENTHSATIHLDAIKFVAAALPKVTTNDVSNINATSSISGGNVTDNGNNPIIARGVCWSTSQNPTIEDNKTKDGTGMGNFTSNITGCAPNTLYYVRAYATNGAGTAYGEQKTFTTISLALPTVTTGKITNVTSSSATCGGTVTNDGNSTVTARGVCWSTSSNPTINDNKTVNGSGTGSFTSNITELNSGATYYVKAYATNDAGTAYGEQRTFTALTGLATVTTANVSPIAVLSAICGGNVASDGSSSVTARGVCWSKSENPTINDNKTTNGSGTGSFTSNITGLTASTVYYVRAYATNSSGTAYGTQRSFTTKQAPSDEWAEVNGIIWATRNVDMPGTFAAKRENAGMFYKWNLKIGWSTTEPMINSNGNDEWDIWPQASTTWAKANDPCPTGWRVPTKEELESLANANSQWTTISGVTGRMFGSGIYSIFLPAAGLRNGSHGSLYWVGSEGYYWSSSSSGGGNPYIIFFRNTYVGLENSYERWWGFSVRCVAE